MAGDEALELGLRVQGPELLDEGGDAPQTRTALLACVGLPNRASPTTPALHEVEPRDPSAADW